MSALLLTSSEVSTIVFNSTAACISSGVSLRDSSCDYSLFPGIVFFSVSAIALSNHAPFDRGLGYCKRERSMPIISNSTFFSLSTSL